MVCCYRTWTEELGAQRGKERRQSADGCGGCTGVAVVGCGCCCSGRWLSSTFEKREMQRDRLFRERERDAGKRRDAGREESFGGRKAGRRRGLRRSGGSYQSYGKKKRKQEEGGGKVSPVCLLRTTSIPTGCSRHRPERAEVEGERGREWRRRS